METMTLNLPNSIMSFLEAEAKRTGSTKEKITEQVLDSYTWKLDQSVNFGKSLPYELSHNYHWKIW